jgi:hypothetical protein
MSHAQPGMAALFNITRWASKTKDQEFPESCLGSGQIVAPLYRAEDIIIRHLAVKMSDKVFKSSIADDRVDILLFHLYADYCEIQGRCSPGSFRIARSMRSSGANKLATWVHRGNQRTTYRSPALSK